MAGGELGEMSEKQKKSRRLAPGASLRLAYKIVVGSLRLLLSYPILVVPMLPVYVLVLFVLLNLSTPDTWPSLLLQFLEVFGVALALMLSFAAISLMLRQLHEGREPSLRAAVLSPDLMKMVPSVMGLTAIWFSVVLVLVIVEMVIRALLDRISESLSDAVVNAIFGTLADALRMAAFMMIAIMAFEKVGVQPAYERLKNVAKREGVTACGGLVLTGLVSALIVLLLVGAEWAVVNLGMGAVSPVLWVVILAPVWLLSMYLEQLFVTGLYLYCTVPDSPVVAALLRDVLGRELPQPA
jgi:hypothetical protein